MSLSPDFFDEVKKGLGSSARKWWTENQEDLAELGQDEAKEIFESLRDGQIHSAKLELVSRLSRAEWKAYRDGTTEALAGIALRRARLVSKLADLTFRAAEQIGKVALGRLPFN